MAEPIASVIIPAHNEERVIARCLSSFLGDPDGPSAGPERLDVVVVCNATTDDTPKIAASFPGVRVVEIDEASKTAAMNAGDSVTTVFPRVYLDADVTVSRPALLEVVHALRDGADAAAPVPLLDLRHCSALSRAYFSIWGRLGYATSHALGPGLYALSQEGRGRFDQFPPVLADDGYVYSLFERDERVNPPGTRFTVYPPATIGAVLRRRVRLARSLRQLHTMGRSMDAPGPGWKDVLLANPSLFGAVAVFLTVNLAAELAARFTPADRTWIRDDSARQVA